MEGLGGGRGCQSKPRTVLAPLGRQPVASVQDLMAETFEKARLCSREYLTLGFAEIESRHILSVILVSENKASESLRAIWPMKGKRR